MTPHEAVENRKRDYQQTFGSPAGQRVLEDLARVCFVAAMDEGPYARDTNETMYRLGLHQAFRHIAMHLSLTTENLMSIYFPVRTRSNDRDDNDHRTTGL